jgi:hypothetical protein
MSKEEIKSLRKYINKINIQKRKDYKLSIV